MSDFLCCKDFSPTITWLLLNKKQSNIIFWSQKHQSLTWTGNCSQWKKRSWAGAAANAASKWIWECKLTGHPLFFRKSSQASPWMAVHVWKLSCKCCFKMNPMVQVTHRVYHTQLDSFFSLGDDCNAFPSPSWSCIMALKLVLATVFLACVMSY